MSDNARSSTAELEAMLRRSPCRVPAVAASQMLHYLALLEKWNVRINLTATSAWPTLGPLFEEAIWAAQFYPETAGNHLDIGSGAGFPAIPLRILRPAMRLRLLEPRARRAAFLETVAAALPLPGTEVICRRAEEFLPGQPAPLFDTVSWKGVKLGREALKLLLAASRPGATFWLFHGTELPAEEPGVITDRLEMIRHERFPGRASWRLSVFSLPG